MALTQCKYLIFKDGKQIVECVALPTGCPKSKMKCEISQFCWIKGAE
jgi:hypothetical protein